MLFMRLSSMSAIIMMKKIEAITVPCGIPDITSCSINITPFATTVYFLCCRKSLIWKIRFFKFTTNNFNDQSSDQLLGWKFKIFADTSSQIYLLVRYILTGNRARSILFPYLYHMHYHLPSNYISPCYCYRKSIN